MVTWEYGRGISDEALADQKELNRHIASRMDLYTIQRQRRISQSQPLVVNWPAVIGCALLILSAWGIVELCKLL